MGNSLTINGLETVGYTVNPEYHLARSDDLDGQDFGEIAPDTAVISSLLLDGDTITGDRTPNRTWPIAVIVVGSSRADLSAKINTFVQAISADTYPVVWTPQGCPSSVFTAYKASFAVKKSFAENGQLVGKISMVFETRPFARSLGTQTITVPATGGTPQLQVDGMNTGTFTNATLDTTIKYEGAGSAKVTLTRSVATVVAGVTFYRYDTPTTAPGRAITSTDLSSYASMSIRFRWPAPATFGGTFSNVTVSLLLVSAAGSSVVSTNLTVAKGSTAQTLVQFDLSKLTTASGSGVNLAAVTSWAAGVAAGSVTDSGLPATSNAWYDDLRAYPTGSVGNSTNEGSVITIPTIKGSARTPVAIAATRVSALGSLLLHVPPITQDPDATIFAGLSAGSIIVPAANMNYDGTYSVVALLSVSGSSTRTITATFTHKIGAFTAGVQAVSVTVAGTQTMVAIDEIELPVVDQPAENTNATTTIALTSTDGSDVFSDVALCDTRGQLALITGIGGVLSAYIDQPDATSDVGPIYGSGTDRTKAFSISSVALISGGPILLQPGGNNRMLVAATGGTPDLSITYTPTWLDEAQL